MVRRRVRVDAAAGQCVLGGWCMSLRERVTV